MWIHINVDSEMCIQAMNSNCAFKSPQSLNLVWQPFVFRLLFLSGVILDEDSGADWSCVDGPSIMAHHDGPSCVQPTSGQKMILDNILNRIRTVGILNDA